MATLGGNVLTLVDWAKRRDPDGKIARIVEMLSQKNEILDNMMWVEGNLPTGHRITVRTGLPTVSWRLLNQGIQVSKSTTSQSDEQTGLLEGWSEVDEETANLGGSVSEVRASEGDSFLESMAQEFAGTMWFGNQSTAPEEFNGFATRYSDLSGTNAQNILDAGGTGSDNSSVWLIGWAANTVCGIFPKGSQAGMEHRDFGLQVNETASGVGGSRLAVWRDQWKWKGGIAVKDWRYAVRIANVDISDLVDKAAGAADLVDLMARATHRLPSLNSVRPSFYMNRTVFQMLDIQRRDDALQHAIGIKIENVDGKIFRTFRGVPIGISDQLIETEARVT